MYVYEFKLKKSKFINKYKKIFLLYIFLFKKYLFKTHVDIFYGLIRVTFICIKEKFQLKYDQNNKIF